MYFSFLLYTSYFLLPNYNGMITVTRLNGTKYYINPHQIECIEIRPDTTLMMLSGKSHIVREEADEVLGRIEAYYRRICPPVIQE